MGTIIAYQQELISPEPAISETSLIAENSPRAAYYKVSIYWLPGAGYRITKTSGASGSKGCQEDYWRPSLKLALHKKELLIAAKLRKKRGPRIYMEVSSTGIVSQKGEAQ
ncbi:MAG: hypothetical protein WC007_14495 [Pelobacteraceae bacterium]